MANTPRKHMTSDEVAPAIPVWFHFNEGTLTATKLLKFTAPFDGCILHIDDVILGWDSSGANDAKLITADVLGSSTFFSTKPSFLGTAAADKSTLKDGTGITRRRSLVGSGRQIVREGRSDYGQPHRVGCR